MMKLSKRLQTVAKFVKKGETVLDIGSDHAYLPVYLVQKAIVPKAIAGEVARGPLENAQKQIAFFQLEDQISVRLGDGLNVLKPKDDVGTVTICGMGGILIAEILKAGFTKGIVPKKARLVLQPNNSEKTLRALLEEHQYKITREEILEEDNKIYEIIVAEYADRKVRYTDNELTFGPVLLKAKPPVFLKKWQAELHRNQQILKQLQNTKNIDQKEEFDRKIQQIKKVIT